MTTAAVAFALLAVALWLAGRRDRRDRAALRARTREGEPMSEREVASSLKPRTGLVEASPRRPPLNDCRT